MFFLKSKGDFHNIERFLKKMQTGDIFKKLDSMGKKGVAALQEATPKRTGLTANSWSYKVEKSRDRVTLSWSNSNFNNGEQIALLIQMGHGTGRGVYVQGIDYINPAMGKVFQEIADEIWEEVINA